MAAVTIGSDFGAQKIKSDTVSTVSPSISHEMIYCGQECLRRNGVAIMVNKRVLNAVLGSNLQNDRMISVHLQGKPFNITVIQVDAPTSNAEEAEVDGSMKTYKTF